MMDDFRKNRIRKDALFPLARSDEEKREALLEPWWEIFIFREKIIHPS
jgi:hypothetical protein